MLGFKVRLKKLLELIQVKSKFKWIMREKIFISGAAGFIGFHACKYLLERHYSIIGLDNLNDYYDINLKKDRLKNLDKLSISSKSDWKFVLGNLEDKLLIENIFKKYKPNVVINLAAQAGVRYSLINPFAYINSNILGFLNILEIARENPIKNLIYASSSSVYGGNIKIPFSENDPVNHPVSLYAATKDQMSLWHILIAIFWNSINRAKILYSLRPLGET